MMSTHQAVSRKTAFRQAIHTIHWIKAMRYLTGKRKYSVKLCDSRIE